MLFLAPLVAGLVFTPAVAPAAVVAVPLALIAAPVAAVIYLSTPSIPTKADLIQSNDVTPPGSQVVSCATIHESDDQIKAAGGHDRLALGEAAKTAWFNSDNALPDPATYKWNVSWRNDVVMYDLSGKYPKIQADWIGDAGDLRVCTLTPR